MTDCIQIGERQPRLTQGRAAEQLGVTREHLNRVLRGHRSSPGLINRYKQLLAVAPMGSETATGNQTGNESR